MNMILEPRSLSHIWSEVRSMRFRVRQIETLQDYLITNIKIWLQGLPHILEMVKCDEQVFTRYSLDAWSKSWILLSSREEIDFLNSLLAHELAFKIKNFYRKLRP